MWCTAVTLAVLSISVAVSGCATGNRPILLEGVHVLVWGKADAATIPALAPLAEHSKAKVWAFSDHGLIYAVGEEPEAEGE